MYKTRLVQYLIATAIELLIYKLMGFEIAVICAIATIIGEMNYRHYNEEDKKKEERIQNALKDWKY